ncbi:zinc finger BED domain-containing protein 4-like [Formica exsecta]|uniref:zinc finger BED domain-containing protein 4-like n=1 Tax=Formica exsecta TaxID=72781 RepID=UPI001144C4C2|nr:zinc finger BED domain-containing protein 4-like [Formica exsecta]
MIAAVNLVVTQKNHLPCFPHTINLVVEAGLKKYVIKTVISKVRAIVKWVKNSVINSDKLRKIQMRNGVSEGSTKKLILDVSTRWNSVYYMLERFVELTKVCSELLLEDYASPEMPTASEIEIIKQLSSLLKPFEFVTKESSGEAANRRFGNIEYNTHAAIATLLDPRFKNIHFQNGIACSKAIQKLRDLIKQDNYNTSSESETEEISSGKTDYDFWHHHLELVMSQKRRKTDKGDQLSMYLS